MTDAPTPEHAPAKAATTAGSILDYARAQPLAAGGIVTGLVCLLLILTIDTWIAQSVREAQSRGVRQFFRTVTDIGKAGPYVVLGLVALLGGRALFLAALPGRIAYLYRRIADMGLYLLVTMAISGAIIHLFKAGLGRLRPKHLVQSGDSGFFYYGAEWTNNSFPSGHTQTIVSVAAVLTILFPRGWPVFIPVAVLIGLSRVMVGAHFLSDVLAGAYIAIATAVLVKARWFTHLDRPIYPPANEPSP